MNNQPIGVLDSGVGGLSVWQEIVQVLANESTIYIGDQKNIPYGTKTAEEIHTLARNLIQFLLQQQVKLIVIACNTITVSCLEKLREEFPKIPLIGTVPVVKLAAEVSKNKKIGILSTIRTASSDYQQHLLQTFAHDCTVINEGTDALVPLIEKGEIAGIDTVLRKILQPFQKAGIDTLALGCTHYPFVEEQIKKIMRQDVTTLDSGAAIARQVKRVLEHNKTMSSNQKQEYRFYTTGNAEQFKMVAKKLINESVRDKIERVENISV